jgi:RHS repeat-associated protein
MGLRTGTTTMNFRIRMIGVWLVAAGLLPSLAVAQTVPTTVQTAVDTTAAPTIEYYHLDALGSVRAVTDTDGNVVRRHDYFPFGDGSVDVSSGSDSIRFTGKERDRETGLDYFAARFYMSSTGRFTSPDPSSPVMIGSTAAAAGVPPNIGDSLLYTYLENPQSWNRYAYVMNNPLRYVDPFGQEPMGHHLIPQRNGLTGLAKEFTDFVKAGKDGIGYPNQPGFNALHREYNVAVEDALKGFEKSFRQPRNNWTLSQWRQAANGILNSSAKPIRDFLDLLNKNNGGRTVSALAAAISTYQPSILLKATYIAQGLGSMSRLPFIIIVSPAMLEPRVAVSVTYCTDKKQCGT